jgi:flagellar hook-length control protein FliK
MENAVNIMAMVQSNSIVKKKFDIPSKTLGNDKTSFSRELNHARKDITKDYSIDSKDVEAKTQRTTEKKTEKFAKILSKHSANAEAMEEHSVESLEQKDAQAIKSDLAVEDIKQLEMVDGDIKIEDPTQSVLDVLQQLIEMMQTQKTEDTSNQQLTELKTKFEDLLQKLTQILEMPKTSQAGELSNLLSSFKSDLTELVAQLQITTENEIDSKQAELLINRLSNKLNETKAQIKQVYQMLQQALKPKDNTEVSQLHSTLAAKAASKEITTENAVKNVETPDENQQIQKLDTDNATDTRDSKDNKHNKDGNESAYKQSDESHYKANEKNEVKQVTLVDKLNQSDVNGAVAPQVENENFQLNIKQANANLQKENLVKFSKSDIINQVIKKADIFVQGSHQEMVMKLEPESLGKINLKIIVENGLITAKFVAESQQVKEVLESSFNQLKDALQEKGISVQGFSVSVGQQGAEFNSGKGLGQWKQTIKLNSKVAGEYMGLDEENIISINPYSYHEGKIDYRA